MVGIVRKAKLAVAAAWTVVLAAGCYQSYSDLTDIAAEADARDADTGDGTSACDGAWLDPTTGYLWENLPSATSRAWDDSVAYCSGLELCGYRAGGWRLPTISEVRSLIRGCPDGTAGGACGITDSCLGTACWSDVCYGCAYLGGPGTGGCYWDGVLAGWCGGWWSSSSCAWDASYAWAGSFSNGGVMYGEKSGSGWVRCVHIGP